MLRESVVHVCERAGVGQGVAFNSKPLPPGSTQWPTGTARGPRPPPGKNNNTQAVAQTNTRTRMHTQKHTKQAHAYTHLTQYTHTNTHSNTHHIAAIDSEGFAVSGRIGIDLRQECVYGMEHVHRGGSRPGRRCAAVR